MTTEYKNIRKTRNALSSVLHVLMNIFFGLATIFIGVLSGSWIVGFILVLVSKWRMFAVRPRYLFLNLKSNLLDLLVGFSFVLFAYFAGSTLAPIHFFFAGAYTLWLVLIKPQTSRFWTLFQALTCVFLSTSAAAILCASLNPILLAALVFLIAYASARHVLVQNNDSLHDGIPAFIFATFLAEIALLCHSWLIVYAFPSIGLMIPQLSLVLSLFSFLAATLYDSVEIHDGQLKFSEAIFPTIFSVVVLLVLFIAFSKPMFNV